MTNALTPYSGSPLFPDPLIPLSPYLRQLNFLLSTSMTNALPLLSPLSSYPLVLYSLIPLFPYSDQLNFLLPTSMTNALSLYPLYPLIPL